MTQITFLHGAHDRLQAIVQWLNQATSLGKRILVYAPVGERSEQLNRLLWMHPPTGFLPHCFADDRLASETPVVIASTLDQPLHDECLLNLSDVVPPGFSRFQALIEVVSTEEDVKLPGRDRFRFYRERGYPLEARDIAGGLG
jgi:DNA polymerase-3 subunit chi